MRIISSLLLAAVLACAQTALARDLGNGRPESVDMSSERLQRLDAKMQSYVDEGRIPGVVTMVARRGKVVQSGAWGTLDVNTGAEVEIDSLFRIYSMTKPVTTVAAMILYEEGRFHLGDPVSRYLPEFKETKVLTDGLEVPQNHDFTIRELMSHTAGMTYGVFGDTTVDRMYRETGLLLNDDMDLATATERLAEIPLLHQPGTRWHYSVSVDVLGRLIEVISQQPLDEFLDQRLFTPLGMDDTFFDVPDDKLHRFGTNHAVNERGEQIVYDKPEDSTFRDVRFFSGGGGLVSTAPDYLKFAQMMLNGGELNGVRILGPKTVQMMRTDHLGENMGSGFGENPAMRAKFGFGLGFGVVTDLAGSQVLGSQGIYSWGGAAGTVFWIDPAEELVAVGMIQHMVSAARPRLREDMMVAIYQAIIEANQR